MPKLTVARLHNQDFRVKHDASPDGNVGVGGLPLGGELQPIREGERGLGLTASQPSD